MTKTLFYLSGHGFGHAARMAEVMRALAAGHERLQICVRTTSPPMFFSDIGPEVEVHQTSLDSGVVEDCGALVINGPATVAALEELMGRRDAVISSEVDVVRREDISIIVSDIPFLAGDVAERAGIPCVGISNFTWDWIYEPYLVRPEHAWIGESIRQSYRKMYTFLQLPLGPVVDLFQQVIRVPLVVRPSRRNKSELLDEFGLKNDARPRVLLGMRDCMAPGVVEMVSTTCHDMIFFSWQPIPDGLPPNIRKVVLGPRLAFQDLLLLSDVVVSKLGYGTLSDSIANETAILWPRRTGFREDDILQVEAKKYVRSQEISMSDFQTGNWRDRLVALIEMPSPRENMSQSGAEVCANLIAQIARM